MAMEVERICAAVSPQIGSHGVPGAVVGVSVAGEIQIRALGCDRPGGTPLSSDAVVRIASMTKPMAAAITLMLVEDGTLELTASIERWVPELADRRVVRTIEGDPDDTVPADRPITVADLLTMRMGIGVLEDSCPTLERAERLGLGLGLPDPTIPLGPDEWTARFAELPLLTQPGNRFLYDLPYSVLGVVLMRASGQTLDQLFRERLLDPLGLASTGFQVPRSARDRLVPAYRSRDGGLVEIDGAGTGSAWSSVPTFQDARGGLVSTAADYLRFAQLLLAGGEGLLSARSINLMTSDQLYRGGPDGPDQGFPDGSSYGYGVQVVPPGGGLGLSRYGWPGGFGTQWYSYPDADTAVVLLTQCASPPVDLAAPFFAAVADGLGR